MPSSASTTRASNAARSIAESERAKEERVNPVAVTPSWRPPSVFEQYRGPSGATAVAHGTAQPLQRTGDGPLPKVSSPPERERRAGGRRLTRSEGNGPRGRPPRAAARDRVRGAGSGGRPRACPAGDS